MSTHSSIRIENKSWSVHTPGKGTDRPTAWFVSWDRSSTSDPKSGRRSRKSLRPPARFKGSDAGCCQFVASERGASGGIALAWPTRIAQPSFGPGPDRLRTAWPPLRVAVSGRQRCPHTLFAGRRGNAPGAGKRICAEGRTDAGERTGFQMTRIVHRSWAC
jgi:hypothetical protein